MEGGMTALSTYLESLDSENIFTVRHDGRHYFCRTIITYHDCGPRASSVKQRIQQKMPFRGPNRKKVAEACRLAKAGDVVHIYEPQPGSGIWKTVSEE
jgi:hypothetical protein